jgi:hypothetical protein
MYPEAIITSFVPQNLVATGSKLLTKLAHYSIGASAPNSEGTSRGSLSDPSLVGSTSEQINIKRHPMKKEAPCFTNKKCRLKNASGSKDLR